MRNETEVAPGDFRNILGRISHRHDTRSVFEAFTSFAACALAAQTREAEYLEEAKRWDRSELGFIARRRPYIRL